jgi:DNA-binding winged helix-turn-helix (wHTH) protein
MMRFGRFEFDLVTRRVRREGEDIHLAPRVFELLVALLDGAPRVVTKRELHARLWPGGAVADATLVALVKQLRAALGDHDREAPLIRTVNRVGYALEAPVMHDDTPTPAGAARWLAIGQRRLPLVTGENVIGRDETANIRLEHPVVSRRHARIVVSDTEAVIEDLGSKNGTFVDGQPVPGGAVRLRDGIQLAFGTVVVTYRESASGMPTVTHFGPADPESH